MSWCRSYAGHTAVLVTLQKQGVWHLARRNLIHFRCSLNVKAFLLGAFGTIIVIIINIAALLCIAFLLVSFISHST